MKNRRLFLKQASYMTVLGILAPVFQAIATINGGKKQKILLRSGWQTINIGDIAHSFGIIALIEKYIPEVEIVLWPNLLDRGVDALIKKYFPKVTVLSSKTSIDGKRSLELQKAFDECNFILHSSGPYVTAKKNLQEWWDETKKPFGIYGVSLNEVDGELQELINHASFFYCRDTESLKYLKNLKLRCPVQKFGPDSTFAISIHNADKAGAYLKSVGLKEKEFICVIPRLRYTPNWKIKGNIPTELDIWKDKVSELYRKEDAEKLREVIIKWVEKTGLKVLVCPEVIYQVEFSKETLVDPLPEDIKKNVVWRDSFWLPDEASSVYAQSRIVIGVEPHSLIMSIANGVPAIHIKQPSDTRKGQMWRDIGLGEWYFLMDETPASQITAVVLNIHNDYPEAIKKVEKSRDYVRKLQKEQMREIKKLL
ncbi:polysaccharide pyruvyl transferase family protein [Pedobacter arcticus]|uniref:polysaccharide pyruvyl transferase family protein n=1 Tax=Pedobacter arcticus TaxID=752140 RepID=UPI0002E34B35|nr:polysaccharide pyruvyl transferase family protein [Pedobacter arcticus]